MICFPNVKINLGLHILNKRNDGFHTIETVFYPVNFSEILEIVINQVFHSGDPKIHLTSDGLSVVGDTARNLVVKAYNMMDQEFSLPPVNIFLYKQLPMGAGLGGGSSDAAFTIKLLNDIFSLNLSNERMKELASKLGSDCAFFIDNKPAYALGRGNELEEFQINLSGYYLVLLYPGIHSDTTSAYGNVKLRGTMDDENNLKNLLQLPVEQWYGKVENDFENNIFEKFPSLAEFKKQLYDAGALYASMSGSGSAIFGIFSQKPDLTAELKKIICFEGLL